MDGARKILASVNLVPAFVPECKVWGTRVATPHGSCPFSLVPCDFPIQLAFHLSYFKLTFYIKPSLHTSSGTAAHLTFVHAQLYSLVIHPLQTYSQRLVVDGCIVTGFPSGRCQTPPSKNNSSGLKPCNQNPAIQCHVKLSKWIQPCLKLASTRSRMIKDIDVGLQWICDHGRPLPWRVTNSIS